MSNARPPSQSSGVSQRGSGLRLAIGVLLFCGSIVIAMIGFARLVNVLDHGGYGTAAMRNSLLILGVAGAGLAGGIATLIWDVTKRFER